MKHLRVFLLVILSLLCLLPLAAQTGEEGETESEPLQLTSSEFSRYITETVDQQMSFYEALTRGEYAPESFKTEGYSVEELVLAAYDHDPGILNARITHLRSRTDTDGARALGLPQLDFQTVVTWIGNPMDAISVQAGQFGTVNLAGSEILLPAEDMVIYGGMENWNYDFKLTLDQPVFTWGKIGTGIEMAETAETISALQVEKIEKETYAKIVVLCQTLYYLGILDNILELQKIVGDRMLEISEDSYTSGFLIYSDVLEARVQAMEIDSAVHDLDGQIRSIVSELRYVTGIEDLSLDTIRLTPDDLVSPTTDLPSAEEVTRKAMEQNTNLALLEKFLRIKDLQTQIDEVSDFLHPDFGLHVELGYSGSRFPFLETDWYGVDDYQLTISLALQDNLYDGGATAAALAGSRFDRQAAEYQYDQALSMLSQTVDATWIDVEISRQKLTYFTTKMENARVQIDIKKTQWENGVGGETDFLVEIIELLTEEISGIREILTYNQNAATLLSIAGEL